MWAAWADVHIVFGINVTELLFPVRGNGPGHVGLGDFLNIIAVTIV